MKIVFVVGAARSGTTLLASEIMAKIPTMLYTGEIDFVWRYGRAFSKTDVRNSGSQKQVNYIRRWFSDFSKAKSTFTVLDKTPANILRLGWLKQVFPDAKVVHIVRDGRAVALSAAKEWQGFSEDSLDSAEFRRKSKKGRFYDVTARKLRLNDRVKNFRSAFEVTADVRKAARVYANILGVQGGLTWGPRVPGLGEVAREYSVLTAAAYQWEFCVRAAQHYSRTSGNEILEVRYESLLCRPEAEVKRVLDYLDIEPPGGDFFQNLKVVDGEAVNRFDRYDKKDFDFVDEMLEPALASLGYID
jgi:hypothetical protein